VATSVFNAPRECRQTREANFGRIGIGLALAASRGEHFGSQLGERLDAYLDGLHVAPRRWRIRTN
jgi:hypothetical protein